MTEEEWLACEEPVRLASWLRDSSRLSERWSRLIGTAACRHVWHLLPDAESRRAVEAAERYADVAATADELSEAFEASFEIAVKHTNREIGTEGRLHCAAWAANSNSHPDELVEGVLHHVLNADLHPGIRWSLLAVVRCIVGNPFRPVTIDPRWLTPDVVALARTAYDERAWETLPVLADAMADAGCDDADILGHLRGPGPHARGCWVVDLVLGKA